MMRDGTEDHRRVDCYQIKLGRMRGRDKVPGRALGEFLGRAVGCGRGVVDVSQGNGVPGTLRKDGGGVGEFGFVDDGGEGGGYDDAADGWAVAGDGFEDGGCAD